MPHQFERTERTRLRRMPERASYDAAVVEAILAEGLYCHVGFSVDGQPYVIPTIYAHIEDRLYIHGSAASRMLRTMGGSLPVCVTVTLLDGLVLARSAFHHSMNYRSVVILGQATEVTDPDERQVALKAIVDHVMPERWADVREPIGSGTEGHQRNPGALGRGVGKSPHRATSGRGGRLSAQLLGG